MSSAVDDAPAPEIPEKEWQNPFEEGTPLHEFFNGVLKENRDAIFVVDDYWGRRGTGKTALSLQMAHGMDQHHGMTLSKASIQPQQIRNAYADERIQSGLVLDEGEVGASNRQAMTHTNQILREIMSMGRVKQKYLVINTPIKGFIDKDILKLADVWISLVRKGLGLVHFLEWEPYSEQLLTPAKQWIEFEDVPTGTDLRQIYNKLDAAKKKRLDGEGGDDWILAEDHQEELQQAREQARQEARNDIIRGIFNHPEIQETAVSQRMVGEAVGVSQTTVSNILRGET